MVFTVFSNARAAFLNQRTDRCEVLREAACPATCAVDPSGSLELPRRGTREGGGAALRDKGRQILVRGIAGTRARGSRLYPDPSDLRGATCCLSGAFGPTCGSRATLHIPACPFCVAITWVPRPGPFPKGFRNSGRTGVTNRRGRLAHSHTPDSDRSEACPGHIQDRSGT